MWCEVLKRKKVAVISDTTGYGTASVNAYVPMFKALGAEVVYQGKCIDAANPDLKPELLRMRSAGSGAITPWSVNAGFLSRIINTRGQMEWDVPIVGQDQLGSGQTMALLEKPEYWAKVYPNNFRPVCYGADKAFGETQALDGVDLAAREGTVLGVLGPNGAGKTTAVRILATLLKATRARAIVAGPRRRRRAGQGARADRAHRPVRERRRAAHRPPEPRTDRRPARLQAQGRQAARAQELLEWFDLAGAGDRPAQDLLRRHAPPPRPRGQPRRPPAIVFLDEPTTGLDPAKREDMWGVVRDLVHDGSTILLTTQYLEEADALADEISVIDHGRVIAHDTPTGLKQIVGGQTLTVRPSDPAQLEETANIIAEISTRSRSSPPAAPSPCPLPATRRSNLVVVAMVAGPRRWPCCRSYC